MANLYKIVFCKFSVIKLNTAHLFVIINLVYRYRQIKAESNQPLLNFVLSDKYPYKKNPRLEIIQVLEGFKINLELFTKIYSEKIITGNIFNGKMFDIISMLTKSL